MLHALLASATDLDQWADLLEGKTDFPELLRRLIATTTPTLTSLSFESAEGTLFEGWDGLTTATVPTAYVPAGAAGWELGTTPKLKGKADEDYTKRTTDPLGLAPATTTFIFCTLRRWSQKTKWAISRRAESHWQDVRVYDANDLLTWLADAPATHIWLSRLLRKRPAGVFDLEHYWHDWAAVVTPPIPPALLLAGRAQAIKPVRQWLTGSTSTLSLLADSRKEAVATLAAVVLALPEAERVPILARTVVVETVEAWHELVASVPPLLLIPLFRHDEAIASAVRHGHQVFIPLDRTDAHHSAVQLPRPLREEAAKVLAKTGIPRHRADALAGVVRRSIAAFRRHRSLKSLGTMAPVWATAAYAPVLLAATFTGAWNENEHAAAADKDVLAALAGQPYEQVRDTLVQLANGPEPPVRQVSSTWYVVDKADVWTLVAHFCTPALLERLAVAALQILGTPLPRYQLPADRQLFANLYGLSAPNSSQLRREVADTLAFLGAEEAAPASIRTTIRRIVADLMARANQVPFVWSSLANVLPQLAEAAPDEFLAGMAQAVQGSSPPIQELFETKKGIIHDSSEHPGLLCALELLAWHPVYLPQATRYLARLAQLAPDITIHNRPDNSLCEIFLPWLPHTTADLTQRMAVLNALLDACPEVGWALLLKLLPTYHSISHHTRQPVWRDWAPAELPKEISYALLLPALEAISVCITQRVSTDATRWEALLGNLPGIAASQRPQLFRQLELFAASPLNEQQRLALSNQLRSIIHRERSLKRRDAGLSLKELTRLEACYQYLLPQELLNRYAWLFNQWPNILSGKIHQRGSDAYTQEITAARHQALDVLLVENPVDKLLEWIPRIEAPAHLGGLLGTRADIADHQKDSLLLHYLGSQNNSEFSFARGLAIEYRLAQPEPMAWAVAEVWHQQNKWSPRQQAAWLETFPDTPSTWALAAELGAETERAYWLLASPYGIKAADATQAFTLLLQHGRPLAAVHVLHLHPEASVATERLTTAMEQVMQLPADSETGLIYSGDELVELVERLANASDVDATRVARLEFALLPIQHGRHQKARLLFRELATHPAFFIEVLRMFTRSADHSDPPTASGEIASNAYRLLRAWDTIPGLTDSTNPDSDYLVAWIAEARALAVAADRSIIAEEQIGEMLSSAPADPDGIWPHRLVRSAVEATASENIERGLSIGKRNGRGPTWRSAFAGGNGERELAAKFTADALAIVVEWPRTAAVLCGIAGSYLHDAEREDDDTTLHQDLG